MQRPEAGSSASCHAPARRSADQRPLMPRSGCSIEALNLQSSRGRHHLASQPVESQEGLLAVHRKQPPPGASLRSPRWSSTRAAASREPPQFLIADRPDDHRGLGPASACEDRTACISLGVVARYGLLHRLLPAETSGVLLQRPRRGRPRGGGNGKTLARPLTCACSCGRELGVVVRDGYPTWSGLPTPSEWPASARSARPVVAASNSCSGRSC